MPLPSPDRIGARLADGWRASTPPAWLAGWEPRTFDLAGGSTEVVVQGSGPTVLLLPGMPGFKEGMIALAEALAPHCRVVTFDLRVRFDAAPSWDAWLDDLARVTHAFAPGSSIVVGHSLGGALAQRWALAAPGRVSALVLSSSFARAGNPAGQLLRRYLEQPLVLLSQRALPAAPALRIARSLAARAAWVYDPACDDAVLGLVRHAIRHQSVAEAATLARLAFAHDTRAQVARLGVPVAVVVGARESAWARARSGALARDIPGATLDTLEGVSHLHPLSRPGGLARVVLRSVV